MYTITGVFEKDTYTCLRSFKQNQLLQRNVTFRQPTLSLVLTEFLSVLKKIALLSLLPFQRVKYSLRTKGLEAVFKQTNALDQQYTLFLLSVYLRTQHLEKKLRKLCVQYAQSIVRMFLPSALLLNKCNHGCWGNVENLLICCHIFDSPW